MITVNIIGILSVVAVMSSLTYMQKARERVTQENLRALKQNLMQYNLDTGHYPDKMVEGDYFTGSGARGGGSGVSAEFSKYIRRMPMNQLRGENDGEVSALNWVTQCDDLDNATYLSVMTEISSANYNGWLYIHKINGEETGVLLIPRGGNDFNGVPYTQW